MRVFLDSSKKFFVRENKISEVEQISLLAVFISHIKVKMAGNNKISANENLRILSLWEGVQYDTVLTGTHWQCDYILKNPAHSTPTRYQPPPAGAWLLGLPAHWRTRP